MAKDIQLSQGLVAVVDDEDFEFLNQWKWCAMKTKSGFYAYRIAQRNYKRTSILMHRVIAATPPDKKTDHRDRDTLNNRRKNLRVCTPFQNQMNRPANSTPDKSSRFKGVLRNRRGGGWVAQFRHKRIGLFESEEAAARAYDAVHIAFAGEFARPNFPEECVS